MLKNRWKSEEVKGTPPSPRFGHAQVFKQYYHEIHCIQKTFHAVFVQLLEACNNPQKMCFNNLSCALLSPYSYKSLYHQVLGGLRPPKTQLESREMTSFGDGHFSCLIFIIIIIIILLLLFFSSLYSFFSSVRSSSVYHGLLYTPALAQTHFFQILQILKCLKDPTCAIFQKSMGFKHIKYDIPVYQM